MLMPGEILIGQHNWQQYAATVPSGQSKGLLPRNYTTHPRGFYRNIKAVDFPTIPQAEWAERIRDKIASKSQLSDILLRRKVPCLDQNGRGYCLPPGSLIRMADGSEKPIETIRITDEVLSASGNKCRVLQLHAREYDGEMVTIKSYGHGHLRLTANHRVITLRGEVEAGQLTDNDWVSVARWAPCESRYIQTAYHCAVFAKTKILVDGTVAESLPHTKRVPDFLEMTRGLGRIFGMWLAEGSRLDSVPNGLVWSFGSEKKMHLADELIMLIREEFGLEAVKKPGPTPSVVNVILHGKRWASLFVSLLGCKADGKRLHGDVTNGPREFLEGVFWGWMDCDGCHRGRRGKAYRCATTVSHTLAQNMYAIANFLGLAPSLNREKSQKNQYAKKGLPPWKVQVNPVPSDRRTNYRFKEENGQLWRKVYRIDRERFKGMVYNIGVEKDHSYVAEGVRILNCWAHSTTGAVQATRAVMNQPVIGLSAYSVACKIKNFRDEGGWGAQSADFIAEHGVCDETVWPMQGTSRSLDNAAAWENAKQYMIAAQLADMQTPQYDRNLAFAQYATLWLLNNPSVDDHNWWGHSIFGADLVNGAACWGFCRTESGKLMTLAEFEFAWEMDNPVTAGFGGRIRNSWGAQWGNQGFGTLTGSKAIPDGGVGIILVLAS